MLVLFDLDGTLIDSAEIVKQSYRLAGANPPDNIFEHEGHAWLNEQFKIKQHAIRAHSDKNRWYVKHLAENDVEFLPPYEVASWFHFQGHHVGVLTGAPHGTCLTLLNRHVDDWNFFTHMHDGLRTTHKINYMKILKEQYGKDEPCVYVDDQPIPRTPRGWKFVQYYGQNETHLRNIILNVADTFKRSKTKKT